MADTHIHIHFGYAPEKPPQVTETAAEEAAEPEAHDALAEQVEKLAEVTQEATAAQTKSSREMAAYHKELQALQKVTRDHTRRMEREMRTYSPTKPPQASMTGKEEMSDEDDRDREFRLMRFHTAGGTLSAEEFDFLKRRGCVRY